MTVGANCVRLKKIIASTCCTRGGGFCEAKDGGVKIKYNLFTKYVEKRM